MLFDLKPKDEPGELFGREAELDRMAELLKAGNWVVVLGPRMVGKTSLIKAANSSKLSAVQPHGAERSQQPPGWIPY
jgi:ABC-type phosphate/phosphonate transport system ATPase subunit